MEPGTSVSRSKVKTEWTTKNKRVIVWHPIITVMKGVSNTPIQQVHLVSRVLDYVLFSRNL